MIQGLTMKAPAKINLGLEVLRRRPDGFHDINTIFAAVDLHDILILRSRDDGKILLRVEGGTDLAADESNLCVRAARALQKELGTERGMEINLLKRIPMGAGLGGGSSDAAAVLIGGARLWRAELSPERLASLALALGSDVPFFLRGGIALAEGQGERLASLDLSLPFSVLLVNPGIHVPTPWAYQAVGRSGERPPSDLAAILERGLQDPVILCREMVNDFEEPVFAEHPTLGRIKERMMESGALFALMSGSGSTMFGLYGDRATALRAAAEFGGYWHVVADPFPAV